MANGIVTPPDYRAANAITGFTEGLKSGVGIVKDVQDIKSQKKQDVRRDNEDKRRQVTDAQADEDRTQNKKDTHIQRVPDYLRSTVAAAYAGKDTEAADILNMVFLPDPKSGVPPVKAKRVTKIQAEDGSPSIEIEYEGGKIVQVDAKVARGWANGRMRAYGEDDGETRDVSPEQIKAAAYAVKEAEATLKEIEGEPARSGELREARANLMAAQKEYATKSGTKIPIHSGVSDESVIPEGEDTQNMFDKPKGTGVSSGSPAPVTTTGPGAAGTATTVERKTKDGKIAIYDATTKEFIRYK